MAINFKEPYIQTLDISPEQLPVKSIDILRLDEIHPVVSGNKWYKLKGHINHILAHQLDGFVTFGGAFSNHLSAAAYAAKGYNLQAHAIVRGQELEHKLSPTLKTCLDLGMILEFVDRTTYKSKAELEYLAHLQQRFPNLLIVPEGGNSSLGLDGFDELIPLISCDYSHIICSVGSGTTISAIANIAAPQQKVLGFVPMKNGIYLKDELKIYNNNLALLDLYHFGGFGKYNTQLVAFMNLFYRRYNVPLDIVYTSKMFCGLFAEIQNGRFDSDANILVVHTGGLQGNQSISPLLEY